MVVTENKTIDLEQILKSHGIFLLSKDDYEEYLKLKQNAEYLKKIRDGIQQIKDGTCTPHDIIEVDDDE